MNIMPNSAPAVVSAFETNRQLMPPSHEIARPVIEAKASEGMAHETRRDEDTRPGRQVERDVQQHPRQEAARSTAHAPVRAETAPPTQSAADNRQVGALLDVFA